MFDLQKIRSRLGEFTNSFAGKDLYLFAAIILANLIFIAFIFYSRASMVFLVKALFFTAVLTLVLTHRRVEKIRNITIIPSSDAACLVLIGALSFSLYSFHAYRFETPVPHNADEYSYLLMAKTFAEGRLANPAHPMRAHFDNFHMINEPSYASKYPPAQGMILAIGILLFNSPLIAVWLSGAVACMACFWMLRAISSRAWALTGALLTLSFPNVFAWSLGYFYGFAALIGIMLGLGALLRILKEPKAVDALIFGLGISILANSRPWEGVLACVPMLALIVWRTFGRRRDTKFLKSLTLKFALPAAAVLILNFSWMALYNYSVTGEATKMPYQAYNEQYDPVPLFLPVVSPPALSADYFDGQKQNYLNEKITRSPVMREFHLYEFDNFYFPLLSMIVEDYNSNPLIFIVKRGFKIFKSLLWISLYAYLLILIAGVVLFPKSGMYMFLFGALAFCFLFNSLATYQQVHYYAPFYGYLIAAVVFVLSRTGRVYPALGKCAAALAVSIILMQVVTIFNSYGFTGKSSVHRHWDVQWVFEKDLKEMPGKHLVVIDYATANYKTRDRYLWITNRSYFNEPDIDASKIVWANSLDAGGNERLFSYFADRDVWILGFGNPDPINGVEEMDDPALSNLYPKLVSCSGRETVRSVNEELKTVLLKLCP